MMSFDVFWVIQEYCVSAICIALTILCTANAVRAIAGAYYTILFNRKKKRRLEEPAESQWEYVDWEEYKPKDAL